MSTTLPIVDGTNVPRSLKFTFDGTAYIPHHLVDGDVSVALKAETSKVIGTVNISAGQAIGISGSVAVTGPLTLAELTSAPVLAQLDTPYDIPVSVSNYPTDAFSRIRVSEPRPIGDYNLSYGLEPLILEEILSGTGNVASFDANARMASLVIGGTAVGHAKLQSYQYHYYQPGRSHLIFLTGVFGTAVANTTKRLGYFDDNNGVYFQQDGSGVWSFTIRSKVTGSVVNNTVVAADWSHAPGHTFDATKNVIMAFDLQFLGMGLVRCYEDEGGVLTLLHEFEHEQLLTGPYMQTATLPVRVEIIQATTAAPAIMKFKCASVMTEGGTDDASGLAFSRESGNITAASGARTHALSIQPVALFNSIENRANIELESIDLLVTGSSPVLLELCIGDVITGSPAFSAVNPAYSGVEYNTTGTTSGAPTAVIMSAFTPATSQNKSSLYKKLVTRYPIALSAAGVARANGRITVLLTGIGGASACRVALNWRELR